MIKLLENYLQEWRTNKQIVEFLNSDQCDIRTKIGERKLRKYFDEINRKHNNHEIDFFIAHSNKGYKISYDKREIVNSGYDNIRQGVTLINKGKATIRAAGENENMDMLDYLIKELEESVINGNL